MNNTLLFLYSLNCKYLYVEEHYISIGVLLIYNYESAGVECDKLLLHLHRDMSNLKTRKIILNFSNTSRGLMLAIYYTVLEAEGHPDR